MNKQVNKNKSSSEKPTKRIGIGLYRERCLGTPSGWAPREGLLEEVTYLLQDWVCVRPQRTSASGCSRGKGNGGEDFGEIAEDPVLSR